MTNIREPIDYYDLKISIVPYELKAFYLTDEAPLFKVRIYNPSDERRYGKIALVWTLGGGIGTKTIIPINVPAKNTEEHNLGREYLYVEGIARYDLKNLGPPEKYDKISEPEIEKIISHSAISFYPLCSYYVRDREIHDYETKEREEKIRLDHSLNRYTIAIFSTCKTAFSFSKLWFQGNVN